MNFNNYLLLTKKQFIDSIPTGRNRKSLTENITSMILMLVLVGIIIASFIIIFSKFVDSYTLIKVNRVKDIDARQYEMLSIVYFSMFVVFTLLSISSLCSNLFENKDLEILITMPFSASEIFLSKITFCYLKEVIISTITTLCVNLTFFITLGNVSAYNVLMSFFVGILLPIAPLFVASILILPFYYIKRFIYSHYGLMFISISLILIAFCLLYSAFFNIIQNLLDSGKIVSMFNETLMTKIIRFSKYSYPTNLLSGLMLKMQVGKNIGIYLAITIVCALLGLVISKLIFNKIANASLSKHIPHISQKELNITKNSKLGSLMFKELITILRTPGYTYMYFSTAVIMPIMVYFTSKLGISVSSNMLGNIDISFEITTFLVILYMTLTNTFCSTNISRDGHMASAIKSLPYSANEILISKIVFCAIVSAISILLSCIILTATGLVSFVSALLTFISAIILSMSQIIFSTRMDLNNPHFPKSIDGELKESNTTVSVVIIIGIVTSFVMGGLLLFSSLKGLLSGNINAEIDKTYSYVIAFVIPIVLLMASIVYYSVNLKKVYANLDAEE